MLTTFTGKASECEIKRPMRVGKNEAGGPEKQVILFVWPNLINFNFFDTQYAKHLAFEKELLFTQVM